MDGGMVAEGAPQVRSQTLGTFLLSMSESATCEVLLQLQTPSMLLCPVLSITSCSSTPEW